MKLVEDAVRKGLVITVLNLDAHLARQEKIAVDRRLIE
jgi:hypothetical protein